MSASLPILLALLAPQPGDAPPSKDGSSLDGEIEALSASLAPDETSGPGISGWVRSRFATSGDVDVDPLGAGDQDLGGFDLDIARIVISGEAADGFDYTVSFEAGDPAISDAQGAGSGVALLDAYASVRLGEWASLSVGRFSATYLWNSGVEERNLLFLDRSFLDEWADGRDVGVELSGAIDRVNWWAAAQNGSDAVADEFVLSVRASVHVLGNSLTTREGALGLGADVEHLTVGAFWLDDASLDDGGAVGGDVVAKGRWSAVGEVIDFDEELEPASVVNPSTGVVIPSGAAVTGSETPFGATVSYLVVPDEWELAVRWQDLDDDAETTVSSAALNRYVAGHDAKWTLQFDASDSDDATLEADTLALGLTVGF